MNREQFLLALSAELNRMSNEEKQAAMEYYREYTMELEADGKDLLATLGTPKEVANALLSDYATRNMLDINAPVKKKSNAVIIAIVLLCGLPVAFPIVIAILSVIFALAITGISVAFAGFVAAIGIVLAGIVCFYSSIAIFTVSPMTGLGMLGISLACIGVGLLFGLIIVKLFSLIISFIGVIFNKLTVRKSKSYNDAVINYVNPKTDSVTSSDIDVNVTNVSDINQQ